MAAPVPRATTFTFIPVFFSNIGKIYPNNPEFSVLVVDEQSISLAAEALTAVKKTIAKVSANKYFRSFISVLLVGFFQNS
jgi:hypothetical protein